MFWSAVKITSKLAVSAALRSLPFSSCGLHFRATTVCTSCFSKKRRTPTGTLLSNRMRNAVTFGVSQDCLDGVLRNFKLLRDFSSAQAIVEIIDDRTDRQTRTAQYGSAALHGRLYFDQRAFRPVDLFLGSH